MALLRRPRSLFTVNHRREISFIQHLFANFFLPPTQHERGYRWEILKRSLWLCLELFLQLYGDFRKTESFSRLFEDIVQNNAEVLMVISSRMKKTLLIRIGAQRHLNLWNETIHRTNGISNHVEASSQNVACEFNDDWTTTFR